MTHIIIYAAALLITILQTNNQIYAENKTKDKSKVKLVLQLTVDQLRGDMIHKFENRLTDSGFKYLMDKGIMFTDAEYIHAITKTAPGHSTLATGTIPTIHGIVNNNWYDIYNKKMVYSCEDKIHPTIGEEDSDDRGRSPANLMTTTTADEIYLSTNGKSKNYGVSVKDRGAIFLAGFSGKAFWFSKDNGHFTSSTYYYDNLPKWAVEWNNANKADELYNRGWELLYDKASYTYNDEEYNKYEHSRSGLGNNFPHKFYDLSKEKFYEYLPYTPYGDLLTLDFTEALISNEDIGKDNIVDYLSISFSCTDYIGHLFGPNSLEYEDQILNLDKVLSRLFIFIDNEVGLENTLIVLSADHGVCESPEYLKDQNINAGILEMNTLEETANEFGRDSLKLDFNIVLKNVAPYFYLDLTKLKETKLSVAEVEKKLASLISKIPGVYKVYTSEQMENGHIENNEIDRFVINSYYRGRSGQLYIVGDPNWYIAGRAATRDNSATHGTPWAYDRFVPLLFGGAGIKHTTVNNRVGPQDIAPTICNFLDIKSPNGAVGNSLLKYFEFENADSSSE